jgi:hypothetical protein
MVNPSQELMLISEGGIVLRTPMEHISVQGRSTQGVTLMDVEGGDAVAAVTIIDMTRDYKEEAALPTGVSAQPEPPSGGKKPRAKAAARGAGKAGGKGKVTPSKAQPSATRPGRASAKGKASVAKAKKAVPPPKAQRSAAKSGKASAKGRASVAKAKKVAPPPKAQRSAAKSGKASAKGRASAAKSAPASRKRSPRKGS